jgi:hypothetical protein
MFECCKIVGRVGDSTGATAVGYYPGSPLLCLNFFQQTGTPAWLWLSEDQQDLLDTLLEKGPIDALIFNQPKLIVGQIGPSPWLFQVAIGVNPSNKEQMAVFKYIDGQRNQTLGHALPVKRLKELRDLLGKARKEAREKAPGRDEEWSVAAAPGAKTIRLRDRAGQEREFEFEPAETPVFGIFGEYFSPAELMPDERLLVSVGQPNVLLAARVQPPKVWPQASQRGVSAPFCQGGQQGDRSVASGNHMDGTSAHSAAVRKFFEAPELPTYVAAKLALSFFWKTSIQLDTAGANSIWNAKTGDPVLGLGVQLIDAGQSGLASHDMLLYQMLSAWMQSLGTEADKALEAVSKLMPLLLETARNEQPALVPMILRNWRCHLEEIEGERLNDLTLADWTRACASFPRAVIGRQPCFPSPANWDPPPNSGTVAKKVAAAPIVIPAPSVWRRMMGRFGRN